MEYYGNLRLASVMEQTAKTRIKKKTDLNYLQPAKRVFTWYLWNVGAALWFSEPLDRESELLMLFKLRERTGER